MFLGFHNQRVFGRFHIQRNCSSKTNTGRWNSFKLIPLPALALRSACTFCGPCIMSLSSRLLQSHYAHCIDPLLIAKLKHWIRKKVPDLLFFATIKLFVSLFPLILSPIVKATIHFSLHVYYFSALNVFKGIINWRFSMPYPDSGSLDKSD